MTRARACDVAICLILLLAIFAVYAPVRHFDFVNYDDPEFVRNNPRVRAGLTRDTAVWAITATESANWFPLTRLSQASDAQIWGMRAAGHHLTNVLLHAVAAMCLFAFLFSATQARWPSAWVSFLFALHPLHVESVAWISERKDVLCAVFWFLTLWAYVRYTRHPGVARYVAALLLFCCGLMAKPMIVTLPVVLILIDVWPLGRRAPFREKIPFFALAAASAAVTYTVQRQSGAVGALAAYPFGERLANATVSYAVYIAKMLWPAHLAVFYPYPNRVPFWGLASAAAVLVAVCILIVRQRSTRPYLFMGWLWYLATLAPVIGVVQVGAQARADRYTYVPMIGLTIGIAWAAVDWAGKKRFRLRAATACAAAVCVLCAVGAAVQLPYWRDSESLFRRALEVTTNNYLAHNQLGTALAAVPGRLPEAISQYRAALAIWPDYADAHNNLGSAWAQMPGRLPDAIAEFEAALRGNPDSAQAHCNLANALAHIPGQQSDAIAQYETALRIDPTLVAARINLGTLLMRTPGRLAQSIEEFRSALRIDPCSAEAQNNLASALAQIPGHLDDAIAGFRAAIQCDPNYAKARNNLANLLAGMPGRLPEAIAQYQAALRADPAYVDAHYNLAVTLAEAGRVPEAISEYQATLRLNPDSATAHYNLGVLLLKTGGSSGDALAHLEAALRLNPNPQLQRVVERMHAGTSR